MGDYGEVGALDFFRLMEEYLSGSRDARSYQQGFFALMKKRAVLSEDESRIVQESYGDADDYDPGIRLPHTIEEPELKKRCRCREARHVRTRRAHAGLEQKYNYCNTKLPTRQAFFPRKSLHRRSSAHDNNCYFCSSPLHPTAPSSTPPPDVRLLSSGDGARGNVHHYHIVRRLRARTV